jgi:hypothetical protein
MVLSANSSHCGLIDISNNQDFSPVDQASSLISGDVS